jgi:UDP-N-acetylglucosamine 2-epimerase
MIRIATVVGARPQFIKAAAVSAAIRSLSDGPIEESLVHTGQHYDASMSEVFFSELGIPAPSHHLGVGSGPHGAQTGEMMKLLESTLTSQRPDAVMVYGDTNSTMAGALVAAKMDLPLIHIEAGLRSGVRSMPEEVNRIVTDHVSTMLLCPCRRAVEQLAYEGVVEGVHDVGDVMLDVLRHNLSSAIPADTTLQRLGVPEGRKLAVATVHRPSNTDSPEALAQVIQGVESLADMGWSIVWPVHPRNAARLADWSPPAGVHPIEPLSYLELLGLLKQSGLVVTDSGGVQREAFWLGVPCVTLRAQTEWPETVESGFNRLWTDRSVPLAEEATRVINASEDLGDPPPSYGDGHAAVQIAQLLASLDNG